MPPTLEADRRREADHLCSELPPRPLTQRDTLVLEADPDYEVYWVRGHYDQSGEEVITQFVIRFNYSHVLAFAYVTDDSRWEVIATGAWPDSLEAIVHNLNLAASPTADWHTPLANFLAER